MIDDTFGVMPGPNNFRRILAATEAGAVPPAPKENAMPTPTPRLHPTFKYPLLTDAQLAELISLFTKHGMRTPQPPGNGISGSIADEMDIYPCQVYAHLGHWRKGRYDGHRAPRLAALPSPAAAPQPADVTIKLSAGEAEQILAAAALLKRRLQQ